MSTNELKFIYDGVELEKHINGYHTVNVEGRGLFSPELNVINVEGRDGTIVNTQNLPARTLKVHFIIRANNSKEKREKELKLNQFLRKAKDVEVQFTDEDGYYMGRYSGFSNIPYDYFQGEGTFDIYCQNPYKIIEISEVEESDYVREESKTKVLLSPINTCDKIEIEEIKGEVVNQKEVRITSKETGDIISLKNLDSTGTLIINREQILLNNLNIKDKLDFNISTWKNFKIEDGDEIVIEGLNSVSFKYRGLVL